MVTREHSSRTHPDPPNKPGENWVEKAGGLPDRIKRRAKHIMYDSGYTWQHAIQAAINQTRKSSDPADVAAIAQWEKMKAGSLKTKLSVSAKYRKEAPTTASKGSDQGYPIKAGDRKKLASAIKLFKMHKDKYSLEKRKRIKDHILAAARKAGVKVELANLEMPVGGRMRAFDEQKHRRIGGKFAQKSGDAPQTGIKPRTAREQITGLKVGETFDIPGVDGSIKRTENGFEITGPDGFKTTAANVTSAMAVAARLIRSKSGGKK